MIGMTKEQVEGELVDFTGDPDVCDHAAFNHFANEMSTRWYGGDALASAWHFFQLGWDAAYKGGE